MNDTHSEGGFGKTPIFIAIILLLLLVNGILLFKNQRIKKDNTEHVEMLETEKGELQTEFDELMQELEDYKIISVEKDSMLIMRESEITEQQEEISRLLRKGKISRSELAQAQELVNSLRLTVNDYKSQIDALNYANQQLTAENTNLKTDITSKTETIESQKSNINELEKEKEILHTEQSILKEEKDMLQSKVNRAEVLQTSNVEAYAVRYKNSGKEVQVDKAKKAEKIKVCFEVLDNALAPKGNKELFLRVISPEGSTLSVEALGSGVFTGAQNGEAMPYTTKGAIAYEQQRENYCMFWEQNTAFASGNYITELYHEGYLIGKGGFALK